MKIFGPAGMRRLDEEAGQMGLPPLLLMENAARATAEVIVRRFNPKPGTPVLVFCGKGNNGADGLALVRHLASRGMKPRPFIAASEGTVSPEGMVHLAIARNLGFSPSFISGPDEVKGIDWPTTPHLIVDALFGTGFQGTLNSPHRELVERMNGAGAPIISLDIPSGVHGGTGWCEGTGVRAAVTIGFQYPKPGYFFHHGLDLCGEVEIVDITLNGPLPGLAEPLGETVEESQVASLLPLRRHFSHKGSYGKLGVWAGSRRFPGAAILAGAPPLMVGAGMVFLFTQQGVPLNGIPAEVIPTAMDENLPWDSADIIDKMDALVIGPGLDFENPGLQDLFFKILDGFKGPILLDASALRLLGERGGISAKKGHHPWILTPHPGEFKALFGMDSRMVLEGGWSEIATLSHEKNLHIILKTPRGLIWTEGRRHLIPRGDPRMAKAGSGDLLSGIIGGFMSQMVERPGEALLLGSYLHALAGTLAGPGAALPSDILPLLPKILCRWRRRYHVPR